jgi:gliding motility-associated-like protein
VRTVALGSPASIANIELKINGVVIATDLAPSSECSWSLRTYTWNSEAATTANIALYDKVFVQQGNDFAIDDISFTTNVVCNLSKTVLITVTPRTIPTFNSVNPICSGATLATLPTSSTNATPITGTWSPALNNLATTTYTFAPATGQCASNGSLTITVNPIVTPTFTTVNPICSGASLAALPTSSTNAPQITGTWSPAPNNLATTTYTFTPSIGQCASNGSMSITVNPNVTPIFTQVPDICSGATLSGLPIISNNTISGNWSPPLDNSTTTNYTFTPDLGQCSSNATMTINITPFPQFSITQGCDSTDFVLSATGIGTTNASYTWFDNLHQNIGTASSLIITNSGNYSLELSNNGCSEEKLVTVSNILCSVPKGISPNGDGDNDTFDLSNLNVQKLQIFNRYGSEVYSKSNYSNEWDGNSNSGENLPDGTYYYIIQFANGKNKTGWIYRNQ